MFARHNEQPRFFLLGFVEVFAFLFGVAFGGFVQTHRLFQLAHANVVRCYVVVSALWAFESDFEMLLIFAPRVAATLGHFDLEDSTDKDEIKATKTLS